MDKGKHIVILTGPGAEDPELIVPLYWLQTVGDIKVATHNDLDTIAKHGYPIKPTVKIADLRVDDFNAVIVPGGLEAPDRLRQVEIITKFVADMYHAGRLVSSTCHGPWVLISAGIMKDKHATGYPGIKDDLVNAGALYEASPVVVDGNLITSDHPRNITSWMEATIAWFQNE